MSDTRPREWRFYVDDRVRFAIWSIIEHDIPALLAELPVLKDDPA